MNQVLLIRCENNFHLGLITDWIPHWRAEGVDFLERRPRLLRFERRVYLEFLVNKLPALSPCPTLEKETTTDMEEVTIREIRLISSLYQRLTDVLLGQRELHVREQSDVAFIVPERYVDVITEPEITEHPLSFAAFLRAMEDSQSGPL